MWGRTLMEINIQTFLIVCPLVFLGGFVDAVAGGGGLITVPAYMIAGLPAHASIATNKLSASMGTTLSTYKLAKAGNIPWKKAVICIIAAVFGGSLGAKLALLVSADLFRIIMLVIIPLTAVYIMRTKSMDSKEDDKDEKRGKTGKNTDAAEAQIEPEADNEPKRSLNSYPNAIATTSVQGRDESDQTKYIILAGIIAFVIGIYDGFYGPGTGTFLILLLSGLAHFKLGEANGTAKAINLTTNISSLVVYLMNGKVMILLGLVAGVFGILGNYIGVNLFMEKGAKIVKPLMITVMVIFFIRIISEIL